jgi:hypothetical protein
LDQINKYHCQCRPGFTGTNKIPVFFSKTSYFVVRRVL